MPAYILTEETLTVIFDDETKVIHSHNPHWETVLDFVRADDWDMVYETMDLETAVRNYSNGKVEVRDGAVWFQGEPIDNSLTERILRMMDEGFNIDPMVRFLENLQTNPSKRSMENLYRFLEHNQLPITEDGYFLAYKNVRDDYYDKHSRTFRNKIGDVCEMPRNKVQDDPEVTCSYGLHFCSIEYLKGFWGTSGHTMVIKINPADVVSIPTDYNNAKGRACRYEVIAEHMDGTKDTLSDQAVYDYDYDDYPYDYEEGMDYDDNGHYSW